MSIYFHRKGKTVETQARETLIRALELGEKTGRDGYMLSIDCGSGTYIRTLCHDIGASLACGGCMSALRRLRAGDFRLENAYTLAQIQAAADRGEAASLLLPVDTLFASCPALKLDAEGEKRIRSGCSVSCRAPEGDCRVYGPEGAFLALGRVRQGELRSIKSFFEV